MPDQRNTYTHGHHDSVLRSHRWRTVANSAAYLIPYLKPGRHVLDIGCGPGTITTDVAQRVTPGSVVGIDNDPAPLGEARAEAQRNGVHNISFAVADVYNLDFADGTFDVVHAHQVLQHLADPVAALREMRRVCKDAGVVAARDADYAAMTWYPAHAVLDRWLDLYRRIARSNRAEPDAGRRLLSWARAAGFSEITSSATAWCYATPEERTWWGGLWADRVTSSALATQAVDQHFATPEVLHDMARGWRQWAVQDDGWFAVLHGEVLCQP
ncbi:MAG: SAM-dependent methyltransferase [Pseudonocardiales bacterium]|nr:methyltransferase domain-containing protein [Pseudonocardiales bacterium]PZS29253.1 MAG: SAM-dependent methyltransferase [Pseudonocardiales bacterium]